MSSSTRTAPASAGQLHRRIAMASDDVSQRALVIPNLELAELQPVRGRDHHAALPWMVYSRPACQLVRDRQRDAGVRASGQPGVVGQGRGLGQLVLVRLLHHAIELPERSAWPSRSSPVWGRCGRGGGRGARGHWRQPVEAPLVSRGRAGWRVLRLRGNVDQARKLVDDAQRLRQRQSLASAEMLPRLPEGSTIQSGTCQPSCCTISIPTVFCPSTCSEFMELRKVDRNHPASLPARASCSRRSRCRAPARGAPLAIGWMSCAVLILPLGRETMAGMPAAAACAASAAEVSPVDTDATARRAMVGAGSPRPCPPSSDYRAHQHRHAQVLERAGVADPTLLDPQVVQPQRLRQPRGGATA